MKVKHY